MVYWESNSTWCTGSTILQGVLAVHIYRVYWVYKSTGCTGSTIQQAVQLQGVLYILSFGDLTIRSTQPSTGSDTLYYRFRYFRGRYYFIIRRATRFNNIYSILQNFLVYFVINQNVIYINLKVYCTMFTYYCK